jgi:hypothetical protein
MSFISSLSWHDLQRLREVVRKVHMANFPEHHINPQEMDKIIEAMGPIALEEELCALIEGEKTAGVNGVQLVPGDRPDITEQESISRKWQIYNEQQAMKKKLIITDAET